MRSKAFVLVAAVLAGCGTSPPISEGVPSDAAAQAKLAEEAHRKQLQAMGDKMKNTKAIAKDTIKKAPAGTPKK